MAQGVLVATSASPRPIAGGSLTEVRVVQPVASLIAATANERWRFTATLDFESVTMPHGQLTAGGWGEGFVDRRHPHTTVHELNLAGTDLLGGLDGRGALGVVVGKGFVPFGTDDPMSRPFTGYPVNHHFSQILERALAAAQYRVGPVTMEAALFNGDEPERPGQWPLLKRDDGTWRFGDSWSVRALLTPVDGLELQGSRATVHSPEHRPGAGGDQVKTSASARWSARYAWGAPYLLAEWARTSELDETFVFHSLLVEGQVRRGVWAAAYRFERTERPEEERLADPYRSRRPHLENSILGTGRWTLHTARVDVDAWRRGDALSATLFVEGTLGRVTKAGPGIFDPVALYGTDRIKQLSAGVALQWRMRDHRMGRYGLLQDHPAGHSHRH